MINSTGLAEGAFTFHSLAIPSRKQAAASIVERRLLQAWDGAAVFATGMVCAFLYTTVQPHEPLLSTPPDGFMLIAMRISLVASLIAPLVFRRVRLSGADIVWPNLLGQVAAQLGILIGLLLAMGFSVQALVYVPRAWASMWSVAITLSVFGGRLLVLALRHQDYARPSGLLRQKVVILGEMFAADALHLHLQGSPGLGLEIVKVFHDCNKLRSLQDCIIDLVDYGKRHPVDRVLLAPGDMTDPELLRNVVNQLKALSADVMLCPYLLGGKNFHPELVHLAGVPFVLLASRPLDLGSLTLKIIEDKVLAALLLALIFPLMLVIAITIRLDSPGPVLFRQRRYGLNNAEFEIWKFRTMTSAPDASGGRELRQTERSDARLTRAGRFLRRSSLDELPQLFNVLRGDMSLVGPRPHPITMRTEGRLGSEIAADYCHRHRVKPGMTGWAQINGSRGATGTTEQIRQRIEFDILYIEHWSIFLDLKILVLTPVSLFLNNDNAS